MTTLTLVDGTEIELIEAGYPQHYVVDTDIKGFVAILAKMCVRENIETMILKEDDYVRTITGSVLTGTQTVANGDDKIIGHFYFESGETTNEINYESLNEEEMEMVAIILAGQIMNGQKTIGEIKNPIVKQKVAQILIDAGMEELAQE